jgi:hypothetical protein
LVYHALPQKHHKIWKKHRLKKIVISQDIPTKFQENKQHRTSRTKETEQQQLPTCITHEAEEEHCGGQQRYGLRKTLKKKILHDYTE